MNKRQLPHLLAAIALWLPAGAWPQQLARLPTVGILSPGAPTVCESGVLGYVAACMVDALRALGDVGGRKVAFEIRYAHGELSRLPVVSSAGSFAADGALLSLGTDVPAIAHRAAFYVHRILGGAKPGDLPVERPTVFKLSVNLQTAEALGLTIPQALLVRADEVIQ